MLLEPHDGDVTIPVAHSSLGYAFLSNLPSTGSVAFNSTGSYWSHTTVLQMSRPLSHSTPALCATCLPICCITAVAVSFVRRAGRFLQMDIWVATTSDSPPHAVSPWQQLQKSYADATGECATVRPSSENGRGRSSPAERCFHV